MGCRLNRCHPISYHYSSLLQALAQMSEKELSQPQPIILLEGLIKTFEISLETLSGQRDLSGLNSLSTDNACKVDSRGCICTANVIPIPGHRFASSKKMALGYRADQRTTNIEVYPLHQAR